jgi:hypothetical protein
MLERLETLCENIADEFDRCRDREEGYVDGNEMREIQSKVRELRLGKGGLCPADCAGSLSPSTKMATPSASMASPRTSSRKSTGFSL